MTTLAGCAASIEAVVERQLPPLPSYAVPVRVPDPKEGDDPVEVAARERRGRVRANGEIARLSDWYACVRAEYAAQHADACR